MTADRPTTEPRTAEEWERSGHGAIRRHYPRTGDALRGFLGGGTTTVCDACGVPMTLKDGKWLAEAAQGAAPRAEGLDDRIMLPNRLVRLEWPPNDGLRPGDARYDEVLDSIRAEGIRDPLLLHLDFRVIDGAHRLCSARQLGIEWVPVRFWTGVEWVPAGATGEGERHE